MPVIITQDDYKGDPKAEEIFGSKTTNLAVWGLKEENTGAIIGRMVARWDEIKDIEVKGFEWVRRADFFTDADVPSFFGGPEL